MHKRTVIVVLALLVALSPFIGLPYSFLLWILPVLGIAIAVLAYPFPRVRPAPEPHDEIQSGV